jgi:hypothetical protein
MNSIDWLRFILWLALNAIALMPAVASAGRIYVLTPMNASPAFDQLLVDPNVAFYFIMIAFTSIADGIVATWRSARGFGGVAFPRSTSPGPLMLVVLVLLGLAGAYGIMLYGASALNALPERLVPLVKRITLYSAFGILPLSIGTELVVTLRTGRG